MRWGTSIRSKLLALLAVPLLVLAALAGLGVRWSSQAAARSRDAARHVERSVVTAATALELSQERGLAAGVLARPSDAELRRDLEFQRGQTDVALRELRAARPGDGPGGWEREVGSLATLRDLRQSLDRPGTAVDAALVRYTALIEELFDAAGTTSDDADAGLLARAAAYDALTHAIEDVTLEQSTLLPVLVRGRFEGSTYDSLVGLRASQEVWLAEFRRGATEQQRTLLDRALGVPSSAAADELRAQVLAAGPLGTVTGDPNLWFTAMNRKVDLLRAAADATAADLTAAADADRAEAERRQVVFVAVAAGAVALVGLLVLLLDRIVVRPIRRLTVAARGVAEVSLPHAVEVAGAEGPDAARAAATPLPVRSADEVGELTSAFNSVQERAVVLAAEQAALRRNVNDVFVNLGRRTQNLITRQLAHIDHLEATTDDPAALADLFLLDHLATRLRRNAESLLVLAGAESPRPWTRPVSVLNVVRAAAAEASDYTRVHFERFDAVAVVGAAVSDLSHLLAELVDNALAFSPPSERVVVRGEGLVDGRYLIAVVDAGMGMSPERLADANRRITDPPIADLAMGRFFGLFVVGRLAQRHGVEVQLVATPGGGVTAHVVVPADLLTAAESPAWAAEPPAPAALAPSAVPTAPAAVQPAGASAPPSAWTEALPAWAEATAASATPTGPPAWSPGPPARSETPTAGP